MAKTLLVIIVIALIIMVMSSCSQRVQTKTIVTSNQNLQSSSYLYKENWSKQDQHRFNVWNSKSSGSYAYKKRKADEQKAFHQWLLSIVGFYGVLKLITN